MIIRYRKTYPDAVEPVRGSEWAAGWDLTCCDIDWDEESKVLVYHTGLAFEIPRGHVGLLFPRSSIYRKTMWLTNSVGVLDADYRGEVLFKYGLRWNTRPEAVLYHVGDRIGQLVVVPIPEVAFIESESLSETKRGAGGYGSTGE